MGREHRDKSGRLKLSNNSISARPILSLSPALISSAAAIQSPRNRIIEDGFPGDNAHLHPQRNLGLSAGQAMLQQGFFCESVTFHVGDHCYSMLLDDVGNCIFSTTKTFSCAYIK